MLTMGKLVGVMTVLLAVLTACAPAEPAAPAGPLVQTVEGITFTVSLSPSQLLSRESATVEIRLSGAEGQPINDGRMVVSMESKGHAMTPNVAAAEPKGNGVYQATLKPAGMTGEHVISADLQWQGRSYRATFGGINVR
ncbi:MAG: hypothetical protein KatS3mg060_1370 [Dehalococcoidia bacterium]|nr:MAG: hypothetical protein KatS3mg060_1370 [Dehalococcoidia bacterium]